MAIANQVFEVVRHGERVIDGCSCAFPRETEKMIGISNSAAGKPLKNYRLHNKWRKYNLAAIIIILLGPMTGFARVQPAGIFTDNAVLQQGEPVRIWGTAASGEKVTVTFSGQSSDTVADKAGHWMVALKAMSVCATGRPLIFQGSETDVPVEVKDVVVGEVWLAGGQSNMTTTMGYYKPGTLPDMDVANDQLLRMVTIPEKYFEEHNKNSHPAWRVASPETVPEFSACAYYFEKNLRETLKVPVGIISCSVGATPVEAWIGYKKLSENPELKHITDTYQQNYQNTFPTETDYSNYLTRYNQAMKEWLKNHTGPRPQQKMGPQHFQRPGGLYEVMLRQTVPYTIRGVIWYQGENDANAQNGFGYRALFSTLISEWREDFQNPELPFLFVQLATYGGIDSDKPYWPELRESQSWTEDHIGTTGMSVIVDGGEEGNIHPNSKNKVGYRLSLLARNMVYGDKDLLCHGPRLKNMKCGKDSIELTFKDTGAGLVLKDGNDAFEICGADGKYIPAETRLDDGKVIVSGIGMIEPKNVRYGWKKWFIPTLFNKEGLPASPFRTDAMPSIFGKASECADPGQPVCRYVVPTD